jgi:hypothetical protein
MGDSAITRPPQQVTNAQPAPPTVNQPEATAKPAEPTKPEAPQHTGQSQLAALQPAPHLHDPHEGLAAEFLQVFDAVIQESYENYRAPRTDSGAGVFSDGRGDGFSGKDMQLIREFMREASHLVHEQAMDMAQVIRWIKTEQGGAFWQKLQQALQKGLPMQEAKSKNPEEKAAQKSAGAEGLGGEGEGPAGEKGQANPGRALLEMIRAEANPKGQVENMIVALQLLKHDGLERSSGKLVAYLRNRWGMSEEEMRHFLGRHHIAYFQGPLLKIEKEKTGNFWYALLAFASVPFAMLLGLSFINAVLAGGIVAVVLLIVAMIYKRE